MLRVRQVFLAAILTMAAAVTCVSRPLPTASLSRVPRENWTYDAMIHLAGDGLVPGMTAQRFEGDWLWDREEMAGFVRSAVMASGECTSKDDKALLGRLALEFRPEHIWMNACDALTKAKPYLDIAALAPAGDVQLLVRDQPGSIDGISTYRGTGIGMLSSSWNVVGTLTNERQEFDGSGFSTLDKAFVRFKTEGWDFQLGKDYEWWGPGYSGAMLLSDNAPSIIYGKVAKDVYFGRHVGYIKITFFTGTFEEGARYYLYGRRFEKRFTRRVDFAVSETAKTGNIRPNPAILVTPSLYTYERLFRNQHDTEAEFNDLVSFDLTYKLSPRFLGYVDMVVDDMQAPNGLYTGTSWHRPRKQGYLLGAYWPDVLGDGRSRFRAEYILIDPGTYGATREDHPDLAYTYHGRVFGHPLGPNSKAVFLRADRTFANHWTGLVEYLARTPKSSSGPNPFNTERLNLLVVRDLTPRASLTARYEHLKLPAEVDQVLLGASLAF